MVLNNLSLLILESWLLADYVNLCFIMYRNSSILLIYQFINVIYLSANCPSNLVSYFLLFKFIFNVSQCLLVSVLNYHIQSSG